MVIYSVFDIFTIFYEAKLQITILPSKSSAEKHHSPAIYSLPRTYEEPILWMFLRFTTDLTDWTDWTDSCPVSAGSKTKTKINPLEMMEGVALAAMLPLWSYKSELLTPKPKAYHHLL